MENKLIELLDEVCVKFSLSCWENTDKIAKYLIDSEQVIVLPCKIGTTIYHLDLEIPEGEVQCSECQENHSGFGEFYCDKDYYGWPSFEDMLYEPSAICPKYKPFIREERFTLNFWSNHCHQLNKSWFLTSEEAHAAIKEYDHENK